MRAEISHSRAESAPQAPPVPALTVVGYDGSPNGRNVVRGAARRLRPGERLVIVHALEGDLGLEGDPASRYNRALNEMHSALDATVLNGADYELRIVAGPPAQALIDTASHCGASAIVIGTRRHPPRIGQRTIRAELEAGPTPVIALFGDAERENHHLALEVDASLRDGFGSFPASDPPSSWVGVPSEAGPGGLGRTP